MVIFVETHHVFNLYMGPTDYKHVLNTTLKRCTDAATLLGVSMERVTYVMDALHPTDQSHGIWMEYKSFEKI